MSSINDDPLVRPFKLGQHTIRHRIVLAPMTRMRASTDGIINPSAADYYSARALPNSLLVSEGTVIDLRGRGFPNTPGIYTPTQMAAWKPIVDAVHERGASFFMQLWHVGRVATPSTTGGLPPLSATAIPLPGVHQTFGGNTSSAEPYVPGEAMSIADIEDVVEQFATAAKGAIEAGFDGVEIHGGNGYVLDTFVHSNINDRSDQYGGSLQNRLRFPLQVVDAIVNAIGNHRTAIRIAPFHVLQETKDADRMTTFSAYVQELEKRQLAYVHMVEARYDQLSTEGAFSANITRAQHDTASQGASEEEKQLLPNTSDIRPAAPTPTSDNFSLWPFRRILKDTPLISAGGFTADSAREAIASGRADLVAIGRHFTSNPDLIEKFERSLPLDPYDRRTFYNGGDCGYLE